MKSLYLLINFFTILFPLIFSFHPKLKFNLNFKPFFLANTAVALAFIGWDMIFTQLGVWGFNHTYVSGLYILNLPIEEILFFICIPFACVFTYHCLNVFYKISWAEKTERIIILLFIASLFITGFVFYDKLYTSVTFISLGLCLAALKFGLKVDFLPKLISIYPVLLIPFFIVNGILTGTGLESPVVWYNNAENMGIRLMTIPLEDVFYGFELILLNVFLYERFKKKSLVIV